GEALTPLLYPLHRPPELAGDRGDRDVLRKDVALEAEAAADVGDQDPHTRRRKVEHRREGRLEDGGRLGGRPHRERLAIPVGVNPSPSSRGWSGRASARRSSAVKTPRTPSRRRAVLASTRRIAAWACGLLTKASDTIRGRTMSSR